MPTIGKEGISDITPGTNPEKRRRVSAQLGRYRALTPLEHDLAGHIEKNAQFMLDALSGDPDDIDIANTEFGIGLQDLIDRVHGLGLAESRVRQVFRDTFLQSKLDSSVKSKLATRITDYCMLRFKSFNNPNR